MYCKMCGSQLADGAAYCPNCGAALQAAPQSIDRSPAEVNDLAQPMTVGQFFLMQFLAAIPVIGWILLLIWAFSSDTNINRKNFSRAALIWTVIGIVAWVIFISAFSAALASFYYR